MEYDHIVIRYGEIALKGKNRKMFTSRLQENVAAQLKQFKAIKISMHRDQMYIVLNGEKPDEIIEKLKNIFGIQSMSVAIKTDNEVELIKQAALHALQSEQNAKTFKITTRRTNKEFPIGSQEFNHVLGGHLLSNTNGHSVDVHHPDVEIKVDIRAKATYITSRKILGAGGLPVGTAGKTLLLLSGGIDSPVAGFLAMKRGVQIEAIHFHSPPFTSERAKQKVIDLAQRLTEYGAKIKIHVVPFTKLQQKIHQEIPHGYSMTVMRRMMMRISETVAKDRDILSLTTGESLGQVASQTMESMHAINDVTNYPIIRPLIAMDKEDIIKIAEQIKTYDISIRPYEDCCTVFVPKAPKTKPKSDKVQYFEGLIDFSDDLKETIEGIETIDIKKDIGIDKELNDLF
ncbi:tRNA uracil 4-sulfurtransferase ThiI [Aquibacillus salsiterrae]|uniref:Probable tRNA sulfurtransferase n=1 Tax=Aquibacillus salsiterrae TaxID=2950439 RepID=A0A9X3WAN8_9BACI|nr:tRNA uracil 4-sulfurtransferase ThiI [Aquibacillus salsiterrae]MDC3415775.1 tRNA 4-thiouridine(8) synthase ThiI [Aquibacillus salsiterrae]